ncbi:MAG: YggT family protein [Gemmatimonadales bacterium]|nr:YggT family protein [Gemmatimonadales bacterium]
MTPWLDLVLRGLVVAGAGFAGVVALTGWLVRSGRLTPFGPWPRLVRRASDRALRPIERRLMGAGGNPQDAPNWLLAGTIIGGLVLLALVRSLVRVAGRLGQLAQLGPVALLWQLVDWTFGLLNVALLLRVLGSWFGISPWAKWMRPFVWLTEWLLEPIRRRLPPTSGVDFSPIVAWLVLMVLRWAVFSVLPR